MNKPVYLGLSILKLSKILMYQFWYDYLKPIYDENANLCYVDAESFIVHVTTDDSYKNISVDVETRPDTSNFEIDKPLLKGTNKKVVGLMKNKLGRKVMIKIVGLRAKTYSCLIDANTEDKKAKGIKKSHK